MCIRDRYDAYGFIFFFQFYKAVVIIDVHLHLPQILADVYGLPIEQLALPAQATALGAAIAGGIGVGLYRDYGVAKQMAPVLRVVQPDPKNHEQYEPLYVLFKDTYTALAPIFERLAVLPQTHEEVI